MLLLADGPLDTLLLDLKKAHKEDMVTSVKDILFAPSHHFDMVRSRISSTGNVSEC